MYLEDKLWDLKVSAPRLTQELFSRFCTVLNEIIYFPKSREQLCILAIFYMYHVASQGLSTYLILLLKKEEKKKKLPSQVGVSFEVLMFKQCVIQETLFFH